MVSSPMRSPPLRSLTSSKLVTMFPRTTNHELMRLPYCRPLSPSEELFDTNLVLESRDIISTHKMIMQLECDPSDEVSSSANAIQNKSELVHPSHRRKSEKLPFENSIPFVASSSKYLPSTSSSSHINDSFEKRLNRFSSTQPTHRRVSGLIKAGGSLSSRSLFGKSNNTHSTKISSLTSCSSFTEECSSSSSYDCIPITTSPGPRKPIRIPSRRMVTKNSQINRDTISQFLGLDKTVHDPKLLEHFYSSNKDNTKAFATESLAPKSDNQANRVGVAASAAVFDADEDDDYSFSECDSMACRDPDDSESSQDYDALTVQKKNPLRHQHIIAPKRQNSIGARMWNKIVTTMSSQRSLISSQKRHVSFGMESDNEVIYIRPYYKYKNVKKHDLWWSTNERRKIRFDDKNLVKSTRLKSLNNEVHLTEIQNDILSYNISFKHSYNKVMSHQELTNKDKNELIEGLYNGHRGLEVYSPRLAHTRYEMIRETVSSIVSLNKNLSLKLREQHQREEHERMTSKTFVHNSRNSSDLSQNEELIISLHRLARMEVAHYQIVSKLVQSHSEVLTAGCRMWARTVGELEQHTVA